MKKMLLFVLLCFPMFLGACATTPAPGLTPNAEFEVFWISVRGNRVSLSGWSDGNIARQSQVGRQRREWFGKLN